jgi:hypothetical protein
MFNRMRVILWRCLTKCLWVKADRATALWKRYQWMVGMPLVDQCIPVMPNEVCPAGKSFDLIAELQKISALLKLD